MRRGADVPPAVLLRWQLSAGRGPSDLKRRRADLRAARRESLRVAEELRKSRRR